MKRNNVFWMFLLLVAVLVMAACQPESGSQAGPTTLPTAPVAPETTTYPAVADTEVEFYCATNGVLNTIKKSELEQHIALCSPTAVAGETIYVYPTASVAPLTNTSWTREDKCNWLRSHFPQTTEEVQALGVALAAEHGIVIPRERVTTNIFHCTVTTAVFDGLVILGQIEGFPKNLVTLSVPPNGAIDSYDQSCDPKPLYSQPPMLMNSMPNKCDSTWRATAGTVSANRLTYWPWNDDSPPLYTSVSVNPPFVASSVEATRTAVVSQVEQYTMTITPAAVVIIEPSATPIPPTAIPNTPMPDDECISGDALAAQRGWGPAELVEPEYGGYEIKLKTAVMLPPMWEAITSGEHLRQQPNEQQMLPGVWTIYPPYACRAALGVK